MAAFLRSGGYETSQERVHKRPQASCTPTKVPTFDAAEKTLRDIALPTFVYMMCIAAYRDIRSRYQRYQRK